MAEIMVRYDDLRLYCEKRHCGSVPLEYIKELPTIEAEPVQKPEMSEADRKKCEEWCKDCEHIEMCKWYPFGGCVFRLLPKPEQPTIDAEPVRRGRWIPTEYDSYADGVPVWDKYECSECGHEHSGEEDTLTEFCPNCGADMREGGAEDENI